MAAELTPHEYLALERQAQTRSDYLAGQRCPRAGCSREHILISGNVLHALQNQLLEDYEVYNSTMRVRTPSGLIAYPDGSVSCYEPQFEDSERDTLLNPILILEVLAKSTEIYDRLTKLEHYRTIPSLAEILLIAQDHPHAEHWVRQGNGRWFVEDVQDLEATVDLPSIRCTLPLKAAYRRALA